MVDGGDDELLALSLQVGQQSLLLQTVDVGISAQGAYQQRQAFASILSEGPGKVGTKVGNSYLHAFIVLLAEADGIGAQRLGIGIGRKHHETGSRLCRQDTRQRQRQHHHNLSHISSRCFFEEWQDFLLSCHSRGN